MGRRRKAISCITPTRSLQQNHFNCKLPEPRRPPPRAGEARRQVAGEAPPPAGDGRWPRPAAAHAQGGGPQG